MAEFYDSDNNGLNCRRTTTTCDYIDMKENRIKKQKTSGALFAIKMVKVLSWKSLRSQKSAQKRLFIIALSVTENEGAIC